MQEVRAGNVGKLEMLFDRHHRALFRYFMHLTSDRAGERGHGAGSLLPDFEVPPHLSGRRPSFRAWMYQIGRNVHMDQAGKRKAGGGDARECGRVRQRRDCRPDRQVQNKQETVLLHRALAALPPEKREVLVMSRFQELRYDEIASVLKCEVGTVKVRVYRALRELGDRFFALGGERA